MQLTNQKVPYKNTRDAKPIPSKQVTIVNNKINMIWTMNILNFPINETKIMTPMLHPLKSNYMYIQDL